jgi:hypothetical protein
MVTIVNYSSIFQKTHGQLTVGWDADSKRIYRSILPPASRLLSLFFFFFFLLFLLSIYFSFIHWSQFSNLRSINDIKRPSVCMALKLTELLPHNGTLLASSLNWNMQLLNEWVSALRFYKRWLRFGIILLNLSICCFWLSFIHRII